MEESKPKKEELPIVKTEDQERESDRRLFQSRKPELVEYLGTYILEHGVVPSVDVIAQQTRISKSTIKRNMNLTVEEWSNLFNKRTGRVLAACAEKAEKGDVNAMRLFFELIEKFSELSGKQKQAAVNKGAVFNINFSDMKKSDKKEEGNTIDIEVNPSDIKDA